MGSQTLPNDLLGGFLEAEDHLKIIWQSLAAQDLVWKVLLTTFLELIPCCSSLSCKEQEHLIIFLI